MGCSSSKETPEEAAERKNNAAIEAQTKAAKLKDVQHIKLLLLGAGESGKSAIFKQIRLLHGARPTGEELKFWRQVIESNVIEAMGTLCRAIEPLGLEDLITHPTDVATLRSADVKWRLNQPMGSSETIGSVIKRLWREDKAVLAAWERRSSIQVVDSHNVFLDDIDRIMDPQYVPTNEDLVLGRVRTTGITSETYEIDGRSFSLYDVGGQRNERRKWIHAFDNVTAVIFVAALSEYDQTCFEDNEKNRMVEAIELFTWIASHESFVKTPLILFLNKIDLLRSKISRHPIGPPLWPDYAGGDFADNAAKYFLQKFLDVAESANDDRSVYHHITCATDASNVSHVFNSCRDTVLKENLAASGLI